MGLYKDIIDSPNSKYWREHFTIYRLRHNCIYIYSKFRFKFNGLGIHYFINDSYGEDYEWADVHAGFFNGAHLNKDIFKERYFWNLKNSAFPCESYFKSADLLHHLNTGSLFTLEIQEIINNPSDLMFLKYLVE